jgi:hypothetical protein
LFEHREDAQTPEYNITAGSACLDARSAISFVFAPMKGDERVAKSIREEPLIRRLSCCYGLVVFDPVV